MRNENFWSNLTSFQKGVYKIVRIIPKGETRSYKWVAEKMGKPKAYRAVGQALNNNSRFDIVPCHRVIKSDGTIGGYSRGVKKKKQLLRKENVFF